MIRSKLIYLFKTSVILTALLTTNFAVAARNQVITVTVTPQSVVSFNNLTLTNANFSANPDGSLTGTGSNTWSYFNNEQNTNKNYKVTGQITSHSSTTAPKGWTMSSTLNSPTDGTAFGKSYGALTLPWSNQAAVNFIDTLPQTKSGNGSQQLAVVVSSIANFTTSQAFTIAWTISSQ